MWKGKPVMGGNVGGIRQQIEDGVNGFLVSSVEEAAERIVQLTKNEELRCTMGKRARETVRERFLLTRVSWNSTSTCLTLWDDFPAPRFSKNLPAKIHVI
jgi:glycosyltransferase involved in cell wall biosynthesis